MHTNAKHKWDQHFGATTIILMDWTRIQTTAVAQSIKSFQIYANITNFPEHKLSSFRGCAIQYIASTSTLYTFWNCTAPNVDFFFLWYKLNKVLFCHNNCVMNVEGSSWNRNSKDVFDSRKIEITVCAWAIWAQRV